MIDLIEFLNNLEPIEWAGGPSFDKADNPDANQAVPYLLWRFKRKDSSLVERIEQAVNSFLGEIEWKFHYRPDRGNMGIHPARLDQVREQIDFSSPTLDVTKTNSRSILQAEDPEFCKAANKEYFQLVEHIMKELS